MRTTSEVLQNEGNPEVQQLLERWQTRAKQGKLSLVCIVGCESPVQMVADYAGIIGMEFAAYTGMDILKNRILMNLENRRQPTVDPKTSKSLVCYNFAKAPSSFDFLSWLVDAEMTRVRANAPSPLRVGFYWGAQTGPDDCLQTHTRRQMFENVIKPSLKLIGAIEDPEAIEGHSSDCYSLAPSAAHIAEGEKPVQFQASMEARKKIADYLGGKKPVVITLRETTYWPHRNSNIDEWTKFAEYLKQKGEEVIFLRDTRYADEPLGEFTTYPEASKDLDLRTALYEASKLNMFVGNGPWVIALFGKSPWMMFAKPDIDDPCFPNTPAGFKYYAGLTTGEQYSWATPDQRIVWEADTYETMVEAWEAWQGNK